MTQTITGDANEDVAGSDPTRPERKLEMAVREMDGDLPLDSLPERVLDPMYQAIVDKVREIA